MYSETELDDEIDIDTFLREYKETFLKLTPEEKAYRIIKSFFMVENPDNDMHTNFTRWLISPENEEVKQGALERVFTECLDGTMGSEVLRK